MKHTRKGITAKALAFVLLIICGLVACPLQAIYCVVLSGKQTSEHVVEVGRPVTIPLSPDLNPIRFVAWIDHEIPTIVSGFEETTNFDATLSQSQTELCSERFSVSVRDDNDEKSRRALTIGSGKRGSTRTNIHTFDLETAGDFGFLVTPGDRHELDFGDIHLKVRQNIRKLNMPVAIAGGILLLLGFGVGAVSFMGKGSQTSEA